jgi:hypothetical protein
MVVDLQKLQKEVVKLKSGKKETKVSKNWKPSTKEVVKGSKTTITIQNKKPAEYVPVYFTAELNKEKNNFFFS